MTYSVQIVWKGNWTDDVLVEKYSNALSLGMLYTSHKKKVRVIRISTGETIYGDD